MIPGPVRLFRVLFAAAALATVGSCTGLKTGTCGQEGQQCCTGSACEALLICSDTNVCTPCGRALGACCPGDTCGSGLVCGAGVCADPSCGGACIPNSKRCSAGGGLDACTQTGTCAAWTTLLPSCPTGFDCRATASDAECVERCPRACTLDALVCSSSGLSKCQLDTNTNCPALFPFADDSTAPVCLAGACQGSWCWESTTPQGTTLRAIDGWAIDQFWTVDEWGNILRRDGNGWAYEHLAQPGKAMRTIAQCGSMNGYLLAAGDNGTVLRRVFGGTWVEESVGDATAQLYSISCVFNFRAFAVGAGGKVFLRDTGTSGAWRALTSNTTRALRGATYYYFTGDGWAVGDDGTIVRCRDLNVPATATCTTETSTTTAQLNAVEANGANGDVVVVGNAGTVLWRTGTGWSATAIGVTSKDLLAVSTHFSSGNDFIAVGIDGVAIKGNGASWIDETPTAIASLKTMHGVLTPEPGIVVAVGDNGAMWFNRGSGVKGAWNALGGAGPTTAHLTGVTGYGSDPMWAVGSGGALFRREKAVWSREAPGVVQGDLYAVATADGGEVFAVGNTTGRKILVGSPGRWAAEDPGTASLLYAVTADDAHAVAVGVAGAWVERPRGPGGSWTQVPTGIGATLLGVSARVSNGRATEVTAVGTNCAAITRTLDGGFTPLAPPTCNNEALLSVWQGADGELLIGGENGYVARRLNGVWSREYIGNTLERVYAVTQSGSTSWAACDNGELYVRINGTWQQELPRFLSSPLMGAWSNPQGDVWVVGTGGLILRGR